jgi:hypothetical protein
MTRADIANYVDAVFLVYSLIIIAYIIVSLVLSLGGRPPFSRAFDAVSSSLKDSEASLQEAIRTLGATS